MNPLSPPHFALQTIHENGNIETLRVAGRRAWAALLRVLQDVNSTVHDLPTPRELYELAHSVLRDESECRISVILRYHEKPLCGHWFSYQYTFRSITVHD